MSNLPPKSLSTEVGRLLLKCGRDLGRSDESLAPIIQRVVVENWLETLESLRQLKSEEWKELCIPKLMVFAIGAELSRTLTLGEAEDEFTISKAFDTEKAFDQHDVLSLEDDEKQDSDPNTLNFFDTGESVVSEDDARRSEVDGTHSVPDSVADAPQHFSDGVYKDIEDPHQHHYQSKDAVFCLGGTVAAARHLGPTSSAEEKEFCPENRRGEPSDRTHQLSSPSESHIVGDSNPNTLTVLQDDSSPKTPSLSRRDDEAGSKSAEEFLRGVAKHLGRSEVEMDSVVRRVVQENWIENQAQLASLTRTQWTQLNLPLIFVETAYNFLHEGSPAEASGSVASSAKPSSRHFAPPNVLDCDNEVEPLLFDISYRLGRTESDMRRMSYIITVQHGITTLDALLQSREFLAAWNLPQLFVSEILRILSDGNACATYRWKALYDPSEAFSPKGNTPVETDITNLRQPPCPHPTKEIPLRDYLVKVGYRCGRTKEQMSPLIRSIMDVHWYHTVASLRLLSDEDWKKLKLPRRLLDEIQHTLFDTDFLEMSEVYPFPVEAAYFPCDVRLAVERMELEIPGSLIHDSARSLLKLVETLLSNPYDRMKRRIKKSNPNFQRNAGRFPATILFLCSIGYQEACDYFVLPVVYTTRLTEAHYALAQVALHRRATPSRKGLLSSMLS